MTTEKHDDLLFATWDRLEKLIQSPDWEYFIDFLTEQRVILQKGVNKAVGKDDYKKAVRLEAKLNYIDALLKIFYRKVHNLSQEVRR